MQLPVVEVKIGTGSEQEDHFLAIVLERQPTREEISKICDTLHDHFHNNDGPFMNREFVKNEVHLWPTPKSRMHFKTPKSAYEEYAEILKILGLDSWVNELPIDGDLCLSRERTASPPPHQQKQQDVIAGDGLFSCIVPR